MLVIRPEPLLPLRSVGPEPAMISTAASLPSSGTVSVPESLPQERETEISPLDWEGSAASNSSPAMRYLNVFMVAVFVNRIVTGDRRASPA